MASLGDKFKNFFGGKSKMADSNSSDPLGSASNSNDQASDDGGDYDDG